MPHLYLKISWSFIKLQKAISTFKRDLNQTPKNLCNISLSHSNDFVFPWPPNSQLCLAKNKMYQYMSMPFGKFIFRTIDKESSSKKRERALININTKVFKSYYSISYWEQLATGESCTLTCIKKKKNHKHGVAKTSWKHEEHCTTHHREEAQPVWTYLQDGRQATGEGCGVWDHGETDKERKTK